MCGAESEAHTPRVRRPVHFLAALFLSTLVAACDDADARRREEMKDRLVGTWLEEAEFEGTKIRRVVSLQKGGAFQQTTQVTDPDGSTRSEATTGEWFFDGETFKRRYRTVNDKQVSGIQFASYQVVSLTDAELACVDHLAEGKRNVRFRRVP